MLTVKSPLEVTLASTLARFAFTLYKVRKWWRRKDVATIEVVDIEPVGDRTYWGRVLMMHEDGEVLYIIHDTITYQECDCEVVLSKDYESKLPAWFLEGRFGFYPKLFWYRRAWVTSFYAYLEAQSKQEREARQHVPSRRASHVLF